MGGAGADSRCTTMTDPDAGTEGAAAVVAARCAWRTAARAATAFWPDAYTGTGDGRRGSASAAWLGWSVYTALLADFDSGSDLDGGSGLEAACGGSERAAVGCKDVC